MNGKVSQLDAHHVGLYRSKNFLQRSDKRYSLEYQPEIQMEKTVVFEVRTFKQMFHSSHIQDKTLRNDLANYFLLGRNIFLSILSGKFDLVPKVQVHFNKNVSGNIEWKEWQDPNYEFPWP